MSAKCGKLGEWGCSSCPAHRVELHPDAGETMLASTCCFCSHLNPVTARFCNDCGSPLELKPCKTCNAVNPRAVQRCQGCDAPFASGEADRALAPEVESVLVVQRAAQAIEAMRRDIAASPSTSVFSRRHGESANERHDVESDVTSPGDAASSVVAGLGVRSELPRAGSWPAVLAADVDVPAIAASDRQPSPAPDHRIGADAVPSAATSSPGEGVAAASPRAEGGVSQDTVVRRGDPSAGVTSRHRTRLAAIVVAFAALALSAALNVQQKGETGGDVSPDASGVPGDTRAVVPDLPPMDAVSGSSSGPSIPAIAAPAADVGAQSTAPDGSPAAPAPAAPVAQDKRGEMPANAEPPAAAVPPASKATAGSKSAKSSKSTVRRATPPRRSAPAPATRRSAIRESSANAGDAVAAPATSVSPRAALYP